MSFHVPLPLEIALFTEEGGVQFWHTTIRVTLPPGGELEAELLAAPDWVEWDFALTFGDLVNPLVEIEHWHKWMRRHTDPLYYSLIKYIYPAALKVTEMKDYAHALVLRNKDVTAQTVEATIWRVESYGDSTKRVEQMFKGIRNLLLALGMLTSEEIAAFIKKAVSSKD